MQRDHFRDIIDLAFPVRDERDLFMLELEGILATMDSGQDCDRDQQCDRVQMRHNRLG